MLFLITDPDLNQGISILFIKFNEFSNFFKIIVNLSKSKEENVVPYHEK